LGLEWLHIIALAIQLIHKTDFDNQTQVNIEFDSVEKVLFISPDSIPALYVDLQLSKKNKSLARYVLIPWQNLYSADIALEDSNQVPLLSRSLITVTEHILMYRIFNPATMTEEEEFQVERFNKRLGKLFQVDINQKVLYENHDFSQPHGWQIISLREYPQYHEMEVALPGTKRVQPFIPENLNLNKMLHVRLIPEIGEVKEQWLYELENQESDPNELALQIVLSLEEILKEALKNPDVNSRMTLFEAAMLKIRNHPEAAAPGFSDKLNYYALLHQRLLNITAYFDSPAELPTDYEPKLTIDLTADYRPSLATAIGQIPDSNLQNLPSLIKQYKTYRRRAKNEPGKWIEGNLALGARPTEYEASDAELLLAEIGSRISFIISQSDNKDIRSVLWKAFRLIWQFNYKEFTFHHVDVMGSGRFFYIDQIVDIDIKLYK
jgi:hypothetical protein